MSKQAPIFSTEVHNHYHEAVDQPTVGAEILSIVGAILAIAAIVVALTVGAVALLALPAIALVWLVWKYPEAALMTIAGAVGLALVIAVGNIALENIDVWIPIVVDSFSQLTKLLGATAAGVTLFLLVVKGVTLVVNKRPKYTMIEETQRPKYLLVMVENGEQMRQAQALLEQKDVAQDVLILQDHQIKVTR